MERGVGKRRRKRPPMGIRHRWISVRVCALALVALLLSCEAGSTQQHDEREPAFDVDALAEEDVVAAVVPEMAPVEGVDTTRITNSGDEKDRKTPSVSGQQGNGDDVSPSSVAGTSTSSTGDLPPREQTLAEATRGVQVVVEVPHEATAAGAAADGTAFASDTDTLSTEDGVHASAAHAQRTAVDAAIAIVANGDGKSEEEQEEQTGWVGGEEGDEQQQQQQQRQGTDTDTEKKLNEPEKGDGTKPSSTKPNLEEQAGCGCTSAADDGCAEASNDDGDDGPGGTNAAPDKEPSDSADGVADGDTRTSNSYGVDSVGRGSGADDVAAGAATTEDQRLPPSESETGPRIDKAAAAAASGDDSDDAVAGPLDDGEGGTVVGTDPSVASTGHAHPDNRGEIQQPIKLPSQPSPGTLADDGRASVGHKKRPSREERVKVERAGRESSTPDLRNGKAGGERYKRRDTNGHQEQGARREQENDGGSSSKGGGGAAGGDAGTDFARSSQEEWAQRMRQMEAEVLRKILPDEDAKSLLDIWVERAREYVLTRTVPATDAECDFNWSRLRCEPKCLCGARLRFGDYTPGRTCRLLNHWERSPDCEAAWDPSDEPAIRRLAATLAWGLGSAKRAYEARVAPPSDPECVFDLETRRCQPQSRCRLKFQWGDLTPSGACRLIQEEKSAASAASGVPLHQ
eukprot:jgi/Undpi1/14083/HiC_scaffold_9.g03734.m1